MKFVDEFRDAELGRAVAGEILSQVEPGRHYKLMEVSGATPTRSTSTASTTCCRPTSSWCTDPVARYA
jgi:Hydrogenase maturation factor